MKNHDLIKKVLPSSSINRIKNKINCLSFNYQKNIYDFINERFILSLVVFLFFILIDMNLLINILLVIIFYILYEYVLLDKKIKKRSYNLENDSLLFFEVLSLSLKSNNNLVDSLKITSNGINSELSKEIKVSLDELNYGRTFEESFLSLTKRIPSDTINIVILNMIEAYKSGSNISENIEMQLDYIRERKILNTKEIITKIPVKISIVSVLIFIPLMTLIILLPVILRLLSQ